ncbi:MULTISPECIES: OmpP1/FadL family transporter [unclassified Marichromatium]|uniref:OmpP1/FadL family transporter n=1 Tax=unclassified Marichromatium TaxID=2618417 RepID=UPI000F3F3574|nr:MULTISPECIES: porin [unclassified Marichromatium]MBO8085363.1 porin [Marichromatium sp.]RNE91218.1 porin [Marichromatium sp. AB31]RNE93264.1 porin [Marichromatium sp. AB32]
MFQRQLPHAVALTAAVGAFAVQAPAQAAGFALPEASIAGLGTANAMVANPDETGAFAYNPAAIAFHDNSSIAVGGLLISPSFSVRTASGEHESQGADWLATPQMQIAARINERWSLGLGVSAPFGLETRWEDGTFPAVSGTRTLAVPAPLDPEVPLGQPTASKLEVIQIAPTVAYRVNDALSVSAGLDLYWGKSAKLNSTAGQLSGDGAGVGFNLSALYVQGPWSLGASFHSASSVGLDGHYVANSQTLVAIGAAEQSQAAKIDFDLPWRLQLGVRYEFNPQLAVEFDWTRTGWTEFDTLEIKGRTTGDLIFADTNGWTDTNAYRLGVTYQLRPDTQLRFGYAFDETGQGDDHFSARVPDNDRHLFSIGVAHSLDRGLSLEAGYMYVMAEDRNYRSNTAYSGHGVNGTDALDGDYEMDAHIFGLELVKVF